MHIIEECKLEILNEARKQNKQIYIVKSDESEFVKVKRSYGESEDQRKAYLAALSELQEKGLVTQVFCNKDIELFELTPEGAYCTTIESARERILDAIKSVGKVYKVHGDRGEFVQLGSKSMNNGDIERILFMRALHELLYHGTLMVVGENREMASYELARPSSGYVQYFRDSTIEDGLHH